MQHGQVGLGAESGPGPRGQAAPGRTYVTRIGRPYSRKADWPGRPRESCDSSFTAAGALAGPSNWGAALMRLREKVGHDRKKRVPGGVVEVDAIREAGSWTVDTGHGRRQRRSIA